MNRPNSIIADIHKTYTAPKRLRRVPAAVREDWSQQVYLEILLLWEVFSESGRQIEEFPDFVYRRLPRKMAEWWRSEKGWESVVLIPDYDMDASYDVMDSAELSNLTEGERRVWSLIEQGYDAKETASIVGKSPEAVRKTLSRIFKKQREEWRRVEEAGETD